MGFQICPLLRETFRIATSGTERIWAANAGDVADSRRIVTDELLPFAVRRVCRRLARSGYRTVEPSYVARSRAVSPANRLARTPLAYVSSPRFAHIGRAPPSFRSEVSAGSISAPSISAPGSASGRHGAPQINGSLASAFHPALTLSSPTAVCSAAEAHRQHYRLGLLSDHLGVARRHPGTRRIANRTSSASSDGGDLPRRRLPFCAQRTSATGR